MWTFVRTVSTDFCPLPRIRCNRYACGVMVKTFREAFLEALDATKTPVAEIARRSGVSREQLNKLRQREGAKTNVDDARRVAAAFGCSLDEFLGERVSTDRGEIANLLAQLTPEERDFLIRAARGLHAQHHEGER